MVRARYIWPQPSTTSLLLRCYWFCLSVSLSLCLSLLLYIYNPNISNNPDNPDNPKYHMSAVQMIWWFISIDIDFMIYIYIWVYTGTWERCIDWPDHSRRQNRCVYSLWDQQLGLSKGGCVLIHFIYHGSSLEFTTLPLCLMLYVYLYINLIAMIAMGDPDNPDSPDNYVYMYIYGCMYVCMHLAAGWEKGWCEYTR